MLYRPWGLQLPGKIPGRVIASTSLSKHRELLMICWATDLKYRSPLNWTCFFCETKQIGIHSPLLNESAPSQPKLVPICTLGLGWRGVSWSKVPCSRTQCTVHLGTNSQPWDHESRALSSYMYTNNTAYAWDAIYNCLSWSSGSSRIVR